ncbi:MAG: hypothetical protein HC927_08415, partial [Deltaproteobacteria bacterium]|nr:hypothetical protein [Deltaproteobacteria bacterium]
MDSRRCLPLVTALTLACSTPPSSSDDEAGEGESTDTQTGDGTNTETNTETETGDETETGEPELESTKIAHQFDPIILAPFEESLPCISWTIENDEPLYVQGVTLANTGGFHHSNGFVVPEELYDGPDGVWSCKDRGFNTIEAATQGTVLFAQSTQSWVEEQRFNPRAVIKIPARHRVVAELHMLNLSPSELDAALRISLELIHPKDVDVVLTPFAYQYTDLEIPPMGESRFVAECDDFMQKAAPNGATYAVHWLLPHYHYLGNYFSVEVIGGPKDGQVLHQIDGFGASPVGKRFDPPIDISDADGIRLTCGYDNWTDKLIGWGNGDQEMCIAFGFAEAALVTQAGGAQGSAVGMVDGIPTFASDCFTLTAPKAPGQGPPTQEEIEGELYLPPIDPEDQG